MLIIIPHLMPIIVTIVFFVLGEEPTDDINDGTADKIFSIIFSNKAKT